MTYEHMICKSKFHSHDDRKENEKQVLLSRAAHLQEMMSLSLKNRILHKWFKLKFYVRTVYA